MPVDPTSSSKFDGFKLKQSEKRTSYLEATEITKMTNELFQQARVLQDRENQIQERLKKLGLKK